MSESADAQRSSTTPDIREGDLVKATNKKNPETFITGRVTSGANGHQWLDLDGISIHAARTFWDIEVLDRPLPPIDEELAHEARRLFYRTPAANQADIKAVINYLREHDTYRKENTK